MVKHGALRGFAPAMAFGVASFVSILLLFSSPLILGVVLLFLTAIFIAFSRSRLNLVIFLAGAIILGMGETIAVFVGGWSYSFATQGQVPYWIFVVWGDTVLFSYRFGVFLRDFLGLEK